MDAAGNLFFAGAGAITPTPGAAQVQPGGGTCPISTPFGGMIQARCLDAYIEKLDATGNVVFATLLGGPTNDLASAVAIDSAENVYVAGSTGGQFPVTANAALPASATSRSFAAKVSADGSRFLYSTYLPDSMNAPQAITVDPQGNAYIAGATTSHHAYILKLSGDGSTFLYTAVLGGSGQETVGALAVDAGGSVAVTGGTTSPDFPVAGRSPLQTKLAGYQNAFVTRLDPAGYVMFSTYLGGTGSDSGNAIQFDSAGHIHVAGATSSLDFPTTSQWFDVSPVVPLWSNSPGGFAARLTADGALGYSTYVMSNGGVVGLALNRSGEAYITGQTGAGFPVTPSAPQPCFAGYFDIFVAHLNSSGGLADATYFGGPWDDWVTNSMMVAPDGSVALTALLATGDGGTQSTFARIRFGGAPACLSPAVLHATTFIGNGAVAPGEFVSLTGLGIGPQTGIVYQPDAQGQPPTTLGGVQVFFDGQAAPLIYVQSRQINAQAPFELDGRPNTTIRVQYNNATFGPITMQVKFSAPGIFRLHPGAGTQAAALNQDGTVNGPSNPTARGSIVALYGTGFGPMDPPCPTGALNPPMPTSLRSGDDVVLYTNSPQSPSVSYAGGAPGLLCGVVQVNMRVPDRLQPSDAVMLLTWETLTSNGMVIAKGSGGGDATITVK